MNRALICAALILPGCAIPLSGAMRPAAGPISMTASPTTARVIFVRPPSFVGSAVSPFIFDGLRMMVLGQAINDAYFAVDLEPGLYQLCPAMIRLDGSGKQMIQFADVELVALGLRTPLTRLEVAAGKTYLLQVGISWQIGISWGPRVEAIPVRPGTLRESRLLEELSRIRASEPVPTSPEFVEVSDKSMLLDWYEMCRESSGPDVRLRVDPDDGKISPPTP